MEIGTKITNLRIMRNMSTNQLAKQSLISQAFLSQIEKNNSSPTLDTLEKICNGLNISLYRLLQFDEEHSIIQNSQLDELVDNIKKLTMPEIHALNLLVLAILERNENKNDE